MHKQTQRDQRAEFLRVLRRSLPPEAFGLATTKRSYLSQAQLARIAGVSVDVIRNLEQGRETSVSPSILDCLASALQMSPVQRKHLYRLSGNGLVPDEPTGESEVMPGEVSGGPITPTLQYILDQQGIYPAYVIDHTWEVIAWNQAATRVFADFGLMTRHQRNLLRCMLGESGRLLIVDWERHARGLVAEFRARTGHYVGEPWFVQLIESLANEFAEFAPWWEEHLVEHTPLIIKELRNRVVDTLRLEQVMLDAYGFPGPTLVLYSSEAGSETSEKLETLAQSGRAKKHLTVVS